MIQFIPFIDWLAALTSITLLIVMWQGSDLGRIEAPVLAAWFGAAAAAQGFSESFLAARLALAAQTVLAAYLIIRWRSV